VAAENEKFVYLKTPSYEAGKARGPAASVDVIENCEMIVKVDVKGRKAPLKIYINYEANAGSSSQ